MTTVARFPQHAVEAQRRRRTVLRHLKYEHLYRGRVDDGDALAVDSNLFRQERDRLQARRLRAGELFAVGVRQAEVARQLGVSAQAVSVWHARWEHGGTEALRSRGPSGPAPRLSDQQLAIVEQALLEGATAHGFTGELDP